MAVTYQLIGARDLDAGLLAAWRAIQAADARWRSPFFCPEFTQAVAAVRRDARVVVIESDGKPAGFFPFQRSYLDGGQPVGGPFSDYHGVVASPGCAWRPAELLRAARLGAWSFDHLVDPCGRLQTHATGLAESPSMDLSQGYQAYAEARRVAGSDYIRKTEGLARKLGREAGELAFELHGGGDALEQMMRWKSIQYRESGLPDAFAAAWSRKLMARLAGAHGEGFAGLCSVLRADGRIVAVHMGMRSASELHYWFPAYDPAFAKYSPGIILLLRVAESLAAQGVRSIDLGKGDSLYKQRLMTNSVPILEGFVERPSAIALLRRWERRAEAQVQSGELPAYQRWPLKVLRRVRWKARYLD